MTTNCNISKEIAAYIEANGHQPLMYFIDKLFSEEEEEYIDIIDVQTKLLVDHDSIYSVKDLFEKNNFCSFRQIHKSGFHLVKNSN